MDDTLIQAELIMVEAELGHLRAQLDAEVERVTAETATLEWNALNDRRRFALDQESARLDVLDRQAQQQTNAVNLQSLEIQMRRLEQLVKEELSDQATYDQIRLQYEALKKQMEEDQVAIDEATSRLGEARGRAQQLEKEAPDIKMVQYLEPLKEAVHVQEARIQEVQERRAMLVLTAPATGQVTQILKRAGETVLAGDPILVVAVGGSERVVAYLDERAVGTLAVGTPVTVSSRRAPGQVARAEVLKVGSQLEQCPQRLWRNPVVAQWGWPVLIGMVPRDTFYPGEMVDLRIRASLGGTTPATH